MGEFADRGGNVKNGLPMPRDGVDSSSLIGAAIRDLSREVQGLKGTTISDLSTEVQNNSTTISDLSTDVQNNSTAISGLSTDVQNLQDNNVMLIASGPIFQPDQLLIVTLSWTDPLYITFLDGQGANSMGSSWNARDLSIWSTVNSRPRTGTGPRTSADIRTIEIPTARGADWPEYQINATRIKPATYTVTAATALTSANKIEMYCFNPNCVRPAEPRLVHADNVIKDSITDDSISVTICAYCSWPLNDNPMILDHYTDSPAVRSLAMEAMEHPLTQSISAWRNATGK